MIDFVKQYERQRGYAKHPVGMTMQFPVPDQAKVNDPLFDSPADWISPGFDDELMSPMQNSRWSRDPPANDGTKVVISDTDHFAQARATRCGPGSRSSGPQPDPHGLRDHRRREPARPSSGTPSYASFEPARYAMGDTLRYAERMDLIEMEPRGELSSTGYALANPGEEYLVLQPSDTADPFNVTLEANAYSVQWHSVSTREAKGAGKAIVESHGAPTRPPSPRPARRC